MLQWEAWSSALGASVTEIVCLEQPAWGIRPQILIRGGLSDSPTHWTPSGPSVLPLDLWGLVTMSSVSKKGVLNCCAYFLARTTPRHTPVPARPARGPPAGSF